MEDGAAPEAKLKPAADPPKAADVSLVELAAAGAAKEKAAAEGAAPGAAPKDGWDWGWVEPKPVGAP